MVSTRLKNISQHGNLPQVGAKIENIGNQHPDDHDHHDDHHDVFQGGFHSGPVLVCFFLVMTMLTSLHSLQPTFVEETKMNVLKTQGIFKIMQNDLLVVGAFNSVEK